MSLVHEASKHTLHGYLAASSRKRRICPSLSSSASHIQGKCNDNQRHRPCKLAIVRQGASLAHAAAVGEVVMKAAATSGQHCSRRGVSGSAHDRICEKRQASISFTSRTSARPAAPCLMMLRLGSTLRFGVGISLAEIRSEEFPLVACCFCCL